MIDCEKARELISCLIDGELDENERAEVMEHIEICPECKAVYEAFSAVSENLPELEEAPEDLCENVMSAIKTGAPVKRKTPWVKYLSVAACLALVIFAGTKLNVSKSNDCAENECADSNGQVVCDESVCDDSTIEEECREVAEDAMADCAPAPKSAAYDEFDTYAAANDFVVFLIRSDGQYVEPDDGFIWRLETETKAPAGESSASEPDYTLSLADGTEYKIFVDGDTVTVHCGDRVYVPDLTAEDIESLFL